MTSCYRGGNDYPMTAWEGKAGRGDGAPRARHTLYTIAPGISLPNMAGSLFNPPLDMHNIVIICK